MRQAAFRVLERLETRTNVRFLFGAYYAIVSVAVSIPLLMGTVAVLAVPTSPRFLALWLGGVVGLAGAWARILLPLRTLSTRPVLCMAVIGALAWGTSAASFLWVIGRHDDGVLEIFFAVLALSGGTLLLGTIVLPGNPPAPPHDTESP